MVLTRQRAQSNRWNVERDESHNPQSLQIFQSGHTKKFLREVVSIGASLFNLIVYIEGVCVKCGAKDES